MTCYAHTGALCGCHQCESRRDYGGLFQASIEEKDMPRRVTHKFGKHMKAVTAGFGGHYAMEACGCCKTYRAKLLDCSGSELKSGEWETSKAAAEQSLFDKLATVAYGLLAGEWEFPREKA